MKVAVVVLLFSVIPLVVFGSASADPNVGTLEVLMTTVEATTSDFVVNVHIPFFFGYRNEQIVNWLNGLVLERVLMFINDNAYWIKASRKSVFETGGSWPVAGVIYADVDVYKVNDRMISVALDYYYYIPTAAHGNEMRDSFTADLESGLLTEAYDLPVDFDKVKDEIAKVILSNKDKFFPDALDVLKDYDFEEMGNFYLTEDSLVVYFQKYEISPGYMGAPEFKIPFSKLGMDPQELRASW